MITVEKTLTLKEAAKLLFRGEGTIREHIKRGYLKAHKEDGKLRIYQKDFDKYVEFVEKPKPRARSYTSFNHENRPINDD